VYAARKKRLEEAETEKAILMLTSSMNSQTNLEDILWDVTSNCIAKLKFEDCVIYLFDDSKKYLHQKAAWGPKTTADNKILNPIVIPVGSGIVGSIAQSGIAEVIADTSLDGRYIVDDQTRLSEICVPIIADGMVMGVIDSEHSKRNFFTHRHLAILNTIASVLGSKMVSMKAAFEKHSAEMALIENKQRTSEVEMKALRAQMNPHFMFNSLNSINNFILKNDADNASAYLTRFARLMRSILDNSRLEWVSLDNELKALQLYIEMESLRFDNVFAYHILVDSSIDAMSVSVPPMIIQPYVENAIWHGLLHRKDVGSELLIKVSLLQDVLTICIEDNGIGRAAADAMKSKFGTHKQSHGMQITAERLQIVNDVYGINAQATIEDRTDDAGKSAGTRVVLTMKCKRNESRNH
jgi:LytS/YehU family sensor histidine kinase